MTDQVISIAIEWASGYINLEKTVQRLENMINALCHQASDVDTMVKYEESYPGKKRKREVDGWLKEVETKKIDFESLKEQAQQARYISVVSRIKLARDADRMMDEISNLIQQRGSFERLLLDVDESKGLPLVEVEWRGPSFERNLQEIWVLLMNAEITSVGIYGMGGVGKTTLAKFIHNDLLRKTTFSHRVYWVTASQQASILKLQNDIAKAINLDLSNEDDEMKRAAKLSEALKRWGKFVILVDDVWTPFDVEKMGIPLVGSKLIVTSRDVDICRKMGCKMRIKVTPLCEEETWELFKKKLDRDEELPSNVEKVAKSMAEKCAGLPLAIATVAGSMKGVDKIYEWRDALAELELISVGESDDVFPILKYSYNRLRDQQLKHCFLCCSLYPEDWRIERHELITLFISEGLIEKETRQKEFDRGHTILNILENACLLEDGDNKHKGEFVKMHDLIREMALKITKSGKPKYMVKAGIGLRYIPAEREWEDDLDKVSLMHNYILSIRKSPKCPKLSTLILRKNALSSISDSFFAYLGELQILDLSFNEYLTKLPDCISNLKNLTALFLEGCKMLSSVPPLGNLEALRELNLEGTNIDKVPEGLERLVKLRSLNMLDTKLKNIPDGTLSRLCSLRCLWIPLEVEVRAEELEALKDLEELSFRFSEVGNLNQFLRSHQSQVGLNFYYITVGPSVYCSAIVNLFPFGTTSQRPKRLVGSGLGGGISEVLLPDGIKELHIGVSDGIKWILKSTSSSSSSSSSSSADHVVVVGGGIVAEEEEGQIGISPCTSTLQRLESAIANATLPPPIFPCLKILVIYCCHRVMKLFTPKLLLRHIPNLEELEVRDCEGLEEIITAEETSGIDQFSHSPRTNTTVVQLSLPKLNYLSLKDLPKLRSIYKGTLICDSIHTIQIEKCLNLKKMPLFLTTINGQLSPSPALQWINILKEEQEWWESLEWDNPESRHVMQPLVGFGVKWKFPTLERPGNSN